MERLIPVSQEQEQTLSTYIKELSNNLSTVRRHILETDITNVSMFAPIYSYTALGQYASIYR